MRMKSTINPRIRANAKRYPKPPLTYDGEIAEFKKEHPYFYFVRTAIKFNGKCLQDMKDMFMPEPDQPEFPPEPPVLRDMRVYGIDEKSFPFILARNTATQAGVWAYRKCESMGWKICWENVLSCLVNLEMDYY